MRIGIVGSRDYPNLDLVREFVRKLPEDICLVSGDGHGVDQVAIEAGEQRFMETLVFPPVRDKGRTEFIRSAFARNQQIVDHSDLIVAFLREGGSRGTLDTLRKAKKARKPWVANGPDGKSMDISSLL